MKNFTRLFLPSFLLAVVIVLLIHFEPFSAPNAARDGFLVELRVSSAKASAARLFFDRGQGFRLLDSKVVPIASAQDQTVRFVVPPGWYQAMRLEVGPGTDGLTLAAARIVDLAGQERSLMSPLQFQAQLATDRVEQQAETLRIAGGATVIFQPPLVLAPPIAWSESLLQLILIAALSVLVLWRMEARLDEFFLRARRLADGMQARPILTIFLAAAGAVIVACHPVIFLGKSYVSPNNRAPTLSGEFDAGPIEDPKGSDTGAVMWAHLPYSVVQHRAIFQDHEWPLWNRFNTCGAPLLGQGQSMLGDPLHWLAIAAAGAPWAWDAKFVLSRLLFAFGVGLLVRAATGRVAVAALLGASAAFIGFFAYRLNHPACFSLGYAPWILLAWWQIARAPGWRAGVTGAALLLAANWCELNSGTAKEAAMLLIGLNATGFLVVAFLNRAAGERARKLVLGTVSGLIFVLLSAPCWLVFLDALSRAYTFYGKPVTYQISPALLLGFFDDLFYRQTAPSELHSNPAANFFVLLGVLWAIAAASRLRGEGGYRALLLGALPPFALAFGLVPASLIERLPFLRNISHIDNTFSCVLIVLMFPLAGFGLRACFDETAEAKWRREWRLVLMLVAVLAALFFGHTQAHARVAAGSAQLGEFPAKSVFFCGYAAALFVALGLLPWALRSLSGRPTIGPCLVAALALAALHFRHGMYGETKFDAYVVNPQERIDLLETTSAIAALRRAQTEPGRVLGIRGVLAPGFNAALGLETPASADALISPYWREIVEAAGVPLVWGWRVAVAKENLPAQQPLFDLMNVRHYLAVPGEPPPTPSSLRSLGAADLEVLTSPTAWPRAFFTDSVQRYGTVQDFIQRVRNGDGRPFASVVEGESAAPVLAAELSARQIVSATDYRLTNNSTEFTVDAPGAGVVVLSEAYEAGCFRVLVNGRSTPSFRANHLFQAVALSTAGRYVIRFSYEPAGWSTSLWLAGLGGGLLLGGLAGLLWTSPKRMPPNMRSGT